MSMPLSEEADYITLFIYLFMKWSSKNAECAAIKRLPIRDHPES